MKKPKHHSAKPRPQRSRPKTKLFVLAAVLLLALMLGRSYVVNHPNYQPIERLSGTTTAQLSAIPLTEGTFDLVRNDSTLGPLAQVVKERLPLYQQWRDQAGHSPGLQLDIVLQVHDYIGSSSSEQEQVKTAQRKIRLWLVQHRPDFIAWEGSGLLNVTFENLIRDTQRMAWSKGQRIPYEQLRYGVKQSIPYDGVLQYLRDDPKARVYGYDEPALNEFHDTLLQLLDRGQGQAGWDGLNQTVGDTRSAIAVYRTVATMQQEGKKHGVLIIGYMHHHKVVEALRQLGVASNIYQFSR